MDFTTFTIPEEITSEEGLSFFFGLFTGAFVRLTRAALRWFKRVKDDGGSD